MGGTQSIWKIEVGGGRCFTEYCALLWNFEPWEGTLRRSGNGVEEEEGAKNDSNVVWLPR